MDPKHYDIADTCYVSPELWYDEHRHEIARRHERADERPEFEVYLLRKPIALTRIEYRIVKFLASKPYWAFTPQQIADAVTTEETPVTEATLDRHIATLRDKLRPYSDYIQSVPYIGYRFKL